VPVKTRRLENGNGIRYFWSFAAGILRTAVLCFWVCEGSIPNPPQQKPLDGEALALIANLSQRNSGIENRGERKRLPQRRCPRVSLEIPELPLGGCFLPLSLKFLTVGILPPINSRGPPPMQVSLRSHPHFSFTACACSLRLCFRRIASAEAPVRFLRLVLLPLFARTFVIHFPALGA
jgi:hypothetical protein